MEENILIKDETRRLSDVINEQAIENGMLESEMTFEEIKDYEDD